MATTKVDIFQHFTPHAWQQTVMESGAKEIYVPAARRLGKSRIGLGRKLRAIKLSHSRRKADIDRYELVPRGFHGWVVAPANPQGRQAWRELKALIPRALIRNIDEQDKFIELNGPEEGLEGLIELKSAHDPESLQSVGLDHLWITEAHYTRNHVFNTVAPTLESPGRLGLAVYEGLPPTWSGHWFWRGSMAARAGELDDTDFFTGTYLENPFLTERQLKRIEDRKLVMTEANWRRTYLAEFNEDAGFFRNVHNCIGVQKLFGPSPGHRYVMGLALGASNSPSVVTVMDAESRALVYHERWDSIGFPNQVEMLKDLYGKWRAEALCPDASGLGKQSVQTLVGTGAFNVQPYKDAENAGVALVGQVRLNYLSALALAFEQGTITIYDEPMLLEQLGSFSHSQTPGGADTAAAPDDEPTDFVFSLALALSVCDPPTERIEGRRRGRRRGSRLPTQAEVNSGRGAGRESLGRQLIRARRSDRLIERHERAEMVSRRRLAEGSGVVIDG